MRPNFTGLISERALNDLLISNTYSKYVQSKLVNVLYPEGASLFSLKKGLPGLFNTSSPMHAVFYPERYIFIGESITSMTLIG